MKLQTLNWYANMLILFGPIILLPILIVVLVLVGRFR
jgi:hypothetical protein